MPTWSYLPLKGALAALLSEKRADHYGGWKWAPFYAEVADLNIPKPKPKGDEPATYQAGGIRGMIEGDSRANQAVLEAMARLLDVQPDHFLEYRLGKLEEWARSDPKLLDRLYDIAAGLADEVTKQ